MDGKEMNPDFRCIALRGKSCTGKTTTLNCVIDILDKKHPKAITHNTRYGRWQGSDRAVAFDIKGHRLVVVTAGDTMDAIGTWLERVKSTPLNENGDEIGNIDLLVCACHQGRSSKYLEENYGPVLFRAIDFTEPQCIFEDEIHKEQAKSIVKMIEHYM